MLGNQLGERQHAFGDGRRHHPARQHAIFEAAVPLPPEIAEKPVLRLARRRRLALNQRQRKGQVIVQRAQ